MAKKSDTPGIVILAAGQGKRMRSPLPKVLHEIGGQPLLFHVLDRVREVAPDTPVAIVVGHGREEVERAVRSSAAFSSLEIAFVQQAEQKGTGHAARMAMDSDWGEDRVSAGARILVLPGDLPLLPASLIRAMLAPLPRDQAIRLLSCELPDPTGYGRVVRKGKRGPVLRIVEEKDASPRERALREVGASIYLFEPGFLKSGLERLSNDNAQGEYYLTDLVAGAARRKRRIDVLQWPEPDDLRGVNDLWELAQAGRILAERIARDWARKGVRFADPWSVRLETGVELADEVVIDRGAVLTGRTRVGRAARIGPGVVLKDVEIGEGAYVKAGTVAEDSAVGARAQVGPYAHLRPGSRVGDGARIGNFVELKQTTIGENTSVAHLSYLGDAEVGRGVNIGCGFITCNFDGRIIEGRRKHRTVIEDDVFMGSDCQAIAPVRIGKGSYVASGSTITEDVEPGALAIARARQVTKPGYASKLRENAREPSERSSARRKS